MADLQQQMAAALMGGSEAAADELKNQKVKIRVRYNGERCVVDAFNVDGNGTNVTYY